MNLIEYIYNMVKTDILDYDTLPSTFMGDEMVIILTYFIFFIVMFLFYYIFRQCLAFFGIGR